MKYLPSILTLIVIAVLSLMPAKEFPETDVPFADKWVHWVMYGFLTVVMIWDSRSLPFGGGLGRGLLCMIVATLYGGLMEVLQATVTTTRSGDWLDALADAFGALCAGVVFLFWKVSKTWEVKGS